ncbi:DNA replication complex GINS protein PSF3-like [Diadema antillarum]|uniref:DNA replication complex GINS protein PSF3-like n=1 Tax=Diadema antillarum TaxID=105358 RepID=UPI003A838882
MAYTRYNNHADNYYDISDILASHEKVPTKVELPLYRLGFLNPGSDGEHIRAGTKLDLPYWLVTGLHGRRRRIVSVEPPKSYRGSYRQITSADANVVDLHKMGPYYYAFGTKIISFDFPESEDIAKSLIETYVGRFRKVMDGSQNASHEDNNRLTSKMDETERSIYRAGQSSLQSFQKWETRRIAKISASDMVSNHRKRKRAEADDND